MTSPTCDEQKRQSMTSTVPELHALDGMPPQHVMEPKKNAGHTTSPPPSDDPETSDITVLPTELLMHIFEYLGPDDVQPYLNHASLHAYKLAQKDLRSVCLVSKQMDAVARQYLYRAVIVKNVDVLVHLVRTFDDSPALGQHIKRLVLEVPFIPKQAHYRKPNVAVLESHPKHSEICQMAVDASNVAKYEGQMEFLRLHYIENSLGTPIMSFDDWAEQKENDILCHLHFEILRRSKNLKYMCFGMIGPSSPSYIFPYLTFLSKFGRAMRLDRGSGKVSGFMSKLQELQLLGDNRDGEGPFSTSFVEELLGNSSLRALKCFHDDGFWFGLNPHQVSFPVPPPISWQCKNITSIDLQQSHCTPAAIFQICATFPFLEHLLVSVDQGTSARQYYDAYVDDFGTRNFLSTGLATLEHLRELHLNLHYKDDVKPVVGKHGVLNLGGLNKLTNVRLPLHFLVEVQPGNQPFITNLKVALPPSVKNLTVWADLDSVTYWGNTSPFTFPLANPASHPGQSSLDFMSSVCGLLGDHFKHLKEATYCYGAQALDEGCHCDAETLCSQCQASQVLDLHATDDSSAQMQILSSLSEIRGVCLRTLREHVED